MPVERYRIGDVAWGEQSPGQPTVTARSVGRPIALSPTHARMVARSGRHRPLEEYVIEWARGTASQPLRRLTSWAPQWVQRWVDLSSTQLTPEESELTAARAEVRNLADAGILVSDLAFTRSVAQTMAQGTPATISRVGFPTRRRPTALRRAIASYCENGRKAGRTFEFVVVDDSREDRGEQETRDLLVDLRAEYGFSMRFAGLAEREAFAQRLALQSGVDLELTQFVVLGDTSFPLTTGSVRNCVLLDCVNEPVLMGDDDGVCRVAPWANPKPGMAFSSTGDPTELLFYENREETLAATEFADIDLLAQHETLLGQSLTDVVRRYDELPALDTLSPRTQARMTQVGGRVQITMAGGVGDSGIGTSAYLALGEASMKRLAQSESFYHAALASRQVNRAVECPTVGDFSFCMSGNLAIDTRSLPPLFTPVLRNSDGVFGQLLRGCHPDAYSGAIPYSVMHDPLEQRSYSLDAWKRDAAHIRYCDVLLTLLGGWSADSAPESTAVAYAQAADYLQQQASSTTQLFGELQRGVQQRSRQRSARFHTSSETQFPEFLQQFRREGMELLDQASRKPDHVVPRDVREISNDDVDAKEATRLLTLRMARLYAAWPALWRAAGELAQQGVRLARPV